ncbi:MULTISPECIES: TetR family transcriptional regulator [Streptomyces]|uniref:TetR family transcriptional regulator n=1 Tax=Streptomyces koelreuteriae TaxID=2838015 RepID=A0ABX8G2D4_9ACTN|nr:MULTISPECIES: TetR family transcriptional regulator [Streptomyces]QWB27332.1 TetR family transcriptional regulator [Streptomyces koelreuteriae]UUA10416.1 TetR family transcriptional regulator [Streptomyces koelreuteriae]UUA18023.1 TetR family transcriptional regulator [Streptomyces sp. CRCS-T-1]
MTDKIDLRERRRLATESEIEDAALDLFERHGFEGTTVDGIAARVGMSQRTFFRYFATKEDAALGPNRAFEALLTARLDGRVAGTSTLRDVEDAVAGVLGELGSGRPDVVRRMVRVRRLVIKDEALRGAALRREAEQCERFLRLLATATGDEAAAPRARLLAETVSVTLRVAFDEWAAGYEPGRESALAETYRATCTSLRELVADH